jgi:hypothetical protein
MKVASNLPQSKDHRLVRAIEFDPVDVLHVLARRAWPDDSFQPHCPQTERWFAVVRDFQYELIFRGPQWFDTKMAKGGHGPVSLVMHLTGCRAGRALALLLILSKHAEESIDATH